MAFRLSKICWGSSFCSSPMLTTQSRSRPSKSWVTLSRDEAAGDSPGLAHLAGTHGLAFEAQAVIVVVALLEPQLAVFLRCLPPVRQSIFANDLCGPVAALPIGSQRLSNAGQEDAHGRQPWLAVDDTDGLHHAGRSRLREGEERAAVVRCLGAGHCDRQKVLDQPLDVGLAPTVAALPAQHDVLDLTVQKVEKVDVLGVPGFTFF